MRIFWMKSKSVVKMKTTVSANASSMSLVWMQILIYSSRGEKSTQISQDGKSVSVCLFPPDTHTPHTIPPAFLCTTLPSSEMVLQGLTWGPEKVPSNSQAPRWPASAPAGTRSGTGLLRNSQTLNKHAARCFVRDRREERCRCCWEIPEQEDHTLSGQGSLPRNAYPNPDLELASSGPDGARGRGRAFQAQAQGIWSPQAWFASGGSGCLRQRGGGYEEPQRSAGMASCSPPEPWKTAELHPKGNRKQLSGYVPQADLHMGPENILKE